MRYGNLCAFDIADCQMAVISNFSNPVKESVFFTNKLIPSFIAKENENNPIFSFESDCIGNTLYSSDYPANQLNHNPIICVPCEEEKEGGSFVNETPSTRPRISGEHHTPKRSS